jgi:hypothetical protein
MWEVREPASDYREPALSALTSALAIRNRAAITLIGLGIEVQRSQLIHRPEALGVKVTIEALPVGA